MLTIYPMDREDILNLNEISRTKNATHLSILSAGSDVLFSCSNAEFSKTYIYDNIAHSTGRVTNYRIPLEVFNLLLRSRKASVNNLNSNLHLVLEEISTPDLPEPELLLYWRHISEEGVAELLLHNTVAPTPISKSVGYKDASESFRVAIGQEYNFQTMLKWYAAWCSKKNIKHRLDMGQSMKYLIDVSRIFKTGIYIKDGLAYADSSKTGVELYRFVDYGGEQMLISHSCVGTLADFAKNTESVLTLFRSEEYMIASTTTCIMLSWRNIRFDSEPNLDDLKASAWTGVYECDLSDMTDIFGNISVSKANQIYLTFDFEHGGLTVRDAAKGKYTFKVDFECIGGGYSGESFDKVALNFRILKNIFSMKSDYNKVHFLIYKSFIRIDLINKIGEDSEEDDSYYDTDNRIIMVVGKSA